MKTEITSGSSARNEAALSVVEMLIVVAMIGIIAALALPSISNIRGVAKRTAAIQNAKNISQMSGALAALGVAHVIPDSMGGVAATARLLREGVIVPEGPMAGEKFILSGLRDDEIEEISEFLYVQYDKRELRLIFEDPHREDTNLSGPEGRVLLCRKGSLPRGILAECVGQLSVVSSLL